jgi:hypothetical protein
MNFPLIKTFKATSYFKAFILNALVAGIITALAIELRLQLEVNTSNYYKFWVNVYNVKKLKESHKLIVSFFITFIVALVAYHSFFILFLFGGGQLNLINESIASFKTLFDERKDVLNPVGKFKK